MSCFELTSEWSHFLFDPLLYENTEKHPPNEQQQQQQLLKQNLDFIAQGKTFSPAWWPFLESQVPVLKTSKIVKVLGHGMSSTAYELDNGHVLKIGSANRGDTVFYNGLINKLHSGKARGQLSRLMVYDFKTFESWDGILLVVETNKVIPFKEYIKMNPHLSKVNSEDLMEILSIVRFLLREFSKTAPEPDLVFKTLRQNDVFKNVLDRSNFPKRDALLIARSIVETLSQFPNRNDLHAGNLGADITGGLDNPQYVWFDS